MYKEFNKSARPPIYDPDEFEKLCARAGAHTIFNSILSAMTGDRHSSERVATNKKRTVAILYKLCYGLNQVCNWLQTDHAVFLKHSNINQEGLQTEQAMGSSCSKSKVDQMIVGQGRSVHISTYARAYNLKSLKYKYYKKTLKK